jgi:hypothetical protein
MAEFLCRAAGWTWLDSPTPTFGDVPKTHPYYGWIERLRERGVTAGCSALPPLYCPDNFNTRAQMAVFVVRAAGLSPLIPPTPSFGDVPPTHWAYAYIERLHQLGVAGCAPGLFCPDAIITRGETAEFECHAFGISHDTCGQQSGLCGIWPDHGSNATPCTVTIGGNALRDGAVPVLRGVGQADIVGYNSLLYGCSAIVTTFDLSGVVPGVWDVVVGLPGGLVLTLPGAFTVEGLSRFEDDFDDPAYTENNWWRATPGCSRVTVDSNGIFQIIGGKDPTNTWSESAAVAASGMAYFVDGCSFGADIRALSGYGGIAWGHRGASGDPLDPDYEVYAAAFSAADDAVAISEESGGKSNDLAVVSVPGIEFNTWYRFEVVSTETHFQVWFGPKGGPLSKVIDVPQDAPHPGVQAHEVGMVVIYAENKPWSTVQFDNFFVQGIPDPVRRLACPVVRALREQRAMVPVWLNDAEGVVGLQCDLYYPTDLLTALTPPQVVKGSLIAGDPNWTLVWNLIAPGHLRVLAYNLLSQPLPAGAHGEVAQAWFTVNPAAAPRAARLLDLENVILADRYGNPIPIAPWDGVVRIARAAEWFTFDTIPSPQCGDPVNPFPFTVTLRAYDEYGDPATHYNGNAVLSDLTGTLDLDLTTVQPDLTAAFSAGLFTGSAGIRQPIDWDRITARDAQDATVTGTSNLFKVIGKGDPTGDGQINVGDVVMSVNLALHPTEGTAAERAAADVNEDGEVNVLDVIIIQNIALGDPPGGQSQGMAALQAAPSARAAGLVVAAGKPPAPGAKKIAVPVLIDRAQGVAGFQFDLAYDGSVLSPVEVRAGALIANKPDWLLNANMAKNPLKVLAFSNQSKALSGGSGTLVEVIFTQTGKLATDSLRLGRTIVSNSAGSALPRTLTLGKPRTVK